MRVATRIDPGLRVVGDEARKFERLGYDGVGVEETRHNAFLPLTIVAQQTERVQFGTWVAIAFPRTPYVTANIAWDLSEYSGGRFLLGLGTQVKGHNERRFSVPWAPPGPRLRDYVNCIRAIWDSWQNRTRPNFESEHYQFSLTSPLFTPEPIEHPRIPIILAAVNPYNARLAGEVGDGIAIHGFCSFRYIREVVVPALHEGARRAGKDPRDLHVTGGGFVITGRTEADVRRAKEAHRRRISFYASTRSYSNIMKMHGWEGEAAELYRLSLEGRWDDMVAIVTDEMMDAFCVIGTWDEMPAKVQEAYEGVNTEVNFPVEINNPDDEAHLAEVVAKIQAIPPAGAASAEDA